MGLNFKGQNRLSLGIINVGFWFLISLLVLTNKDYFNENLRTENPFLITNIYITYIALQFVFDWVGARLFNNNAFNAVWFIQWLVGTLFQFGIWLCLFYLISSFSFKGGLFFSVLIVLLILPFLQGPFAVLINLNRYSKEKNDKYNENLLIINTNEKSFTGDVVYYFFRKINVISNAIRSSDYYSIESLRRSDSFNILLKTNSVLIIWNLLGVLIGEVFNLYESDKIELKVLYFASWMTVWSFLSLILLTRLSHNSVYACDAIAKNENKSLLIKWIKHFPDIVGENGHQNPLKQAVFYPIPSIKSRLDALKTNNIRSINFGNLTRRNLFISWGVFNLSARSVHCNVGRPLLWVLPPS